MTLRTALLLTAIPALAACGSVEPAEKANPQDEFWAALSTHCENAYEGGLVSEDAADEDMAEAEMVMHVRTCDDEQITVPFHIKGQDGAWNRSRTWVFTRTGANGSGGMRLKHDHRHEDGESDDVTMSGGDTADTGSARLQSFPVDQESIDMFKREGLDASVTNVWSVAVDPAGSGDDAKFAYQLTRKQALGAPEDRNFRVEFDLTNAVEAPPAPWGF
jgi:hypothetical protein